ncbi:MAG: hypothetical protein ACHQ7N_01250 [Candidatus Methylomirabilales bacterium]
MKVQGWYVVGPDGHIGPWDLVALHAELGVKLIHLLIEEPGRAERAELMAFFGHESWAREVWVYQDSTKTPLILRLPHAPPLTFRGLGSCDGCGTRLDPKDEISGLCEECRGTKDTGAVPEGPERNH